jgi:N-acetylglucosamine kinase-like BadF-type ATPase
MATVCRSVDGRGPATALERALPDSLGLDSAGDLLRMTGIGGLARERIAALAPLVLDAVDAGDASAMRIVAEAIDELARMVEAVERRLFAGNATMLTMTGGLTERRSFRDALERAITARSPSVRPVASRLPPVLGAAALALASIGALDDDIVARLEESARRRFTTTGA